MRRSMVVGMLGVALALCALALSSPAFAADEKWPTRPIMIYVGFAPGGGLDTMARLLSEEMRKTLGVAMPVVNMPGANGAIAMDHVYKQPKDGYSLYVISTSHTTYPASGISNLTYKEFGLIGIAFEQVATFTVPWDSPFKTGKDLIEAFKKGNLTGSNSGIGGAWHVPQVFLMNMLGGKFKAVPYENGPNSALAVAKKEVDFGTCDLSEIVTLTNAKMIRPLFYFDDKPFNLEGFGVIPPITDFLPQVKDSLYVGRGFRALGYARGIPEDRIKKLTDAFKAAMATDAVKNFGKKNLLPLGNAVGADADKIFTLQTQVQSWLLYDIGEAKRSPDALGIPRPPK